MCGDFKLQKNSGNELTSLFPLEALSKLAVLDVSRNKFARLPDDLGSASLENLSQVNASFNELVEIPENLVDLPSLKLLNLETNRITHVPANLSQCVKLKDLLLKDNKLKDNRLKKLIEQDKGKAIIDYLERIYVEELKTKPKAASKNQVAAAKKKSGKNVSEAVVEYDLVKVIHHAQVKTNPIEVVYDECTVSSVRPFAVFCVVRNIDLNTPGNLKKFLNIQVR